VLKKSRITDEILNSLNSSPVWLLEEHLLKANLKLLKYIKIRVD